MDSRGKSKLALMIFLSLSPLPLIFYLLNCSGCRANDFFWLTVYYVFISLEMAIAGSLINGSKSCFCQSQTNKTPSVSIRFFVSAFLKQALFPSKHHWRVMHQYPWVFQQRDFFYPVMPRAEVPHWVMSRTQPAALKSKGRERERERERCDLRKAEKILTPKCAGQTNGVNEAKCMKLGPAHRDLQLSSSIQLFFIQMLSELLLSSQSFLECEQLNISLVQTFCP